MQEDNNNKGLHKKWAPSQLMTAINCLTYGMMCFYYDRTTHKLYNCLLSVHEEYINILHVIVQGKVSILFEMQNIDNISDKDIYITKMLKQKDYSHFIIVYTSVLDNFVLALPSENQKNVLWEGMQYFAHEAKHFYSKISKLDPFKAEATMLFLEADQDGSNLLDIDECYRIFCKLRINESKQEILNNIKQINIDLYQKQNLKRPKDFSMSMLTPIGFEYLLRYYSMKESLAPIFNSLCPIFQVKHKKYKKTIIQILKSQNKPLMSSNQLQQFIEIYLKSQATLQQCDDIIHSFPVYDGQGRQIPQEEQLMSFHHFCNFIFVPHNSLMQPKKAQIYQQMSLPLNQYYIYSSNNTYLMQDKINLDSKLEMYEICLKKGCRCVELDIQNINAGIVVKHKKSKNYILLQDVLKTIKNLGFSINPFPILLLIENNCDKNVYDQVAEIFQSQLGSDLLVMNSQNFQKELLPSPLELRNKIILMSTMKSEKNIEDRSKLSKIITLTQRKVDFERKGMTCWNFSQINKKNIHSFENIEPKNLTDFSRKGLVRGTPNEKKNDLQNYDPMPMFRNGIQLIAMNLQTQDINHYILHSKFIQNGGKACGYLLKPKWIQGSSLQSLYSNEFSKPIWQVKLKIYAAQKYVLAKTNLKQCWLQIFVKGTLIEEDKNKKFVSQSKSDGFYADFQLQCQFTIYCPDISCIVFSVTNEAKQILAARAITINTIRQGIRTIQLLGPGMQLHQNSYILAECSLKEVLKSVKKISVFS